MKIITYCPHCEKEIWIVADELPREVVLLGKKRLAGGVE